MTNIEEKKSETRFRHSLESQAAFAELSGDFNPVHLSPELARRTLFGQVVVHGVHNVLRSLEVFLKNRPLRVDRLAVTFKNPVFLNEDVSMALSDETDTSALLTLRCGGADAAGIRLVGHVQDSSARAPSLGHPEFPRQPTGKTLQQLENEDGVIDLAGDATAINKAFPQCVQALGIDGVARLLGLTRLVGMSCPGLHSMFSGFDVSFSADRSSAPTRYRVVRADDRVSMIGISVEGGGMQGNVAAFVRPAPVDQPDMVAVQQRVNGAPYQGLRALVVGGSRGLGEVSAKIIAAGGGDVAISYLSGHNDAIRIATDISRAGGTCRILQMDVSDPASSINALGNDGWMPTHLLYFATPRISARKPDEADTCVTRQFSDVYSTGLEKVVAALRARSNEPLTIFYPSSIYVVEGPADLTEYAAAKTAGETTARGLAKNDAGINVIIERLPPLATDQTASLLDITIDEPLEVMAHVLSKALC